VFTFAMRVVGLGYAMVVAFFVIYATQPFAADFIGIIGGFVLVFGGMGLAAVLWAGARRRPWFWLVSVIPGILALLFNAFYGPYGLTHPADTLTFVTTVLALAGGILIVVGSLTSWLEVRRGGSLWESRGRAGTIVTGVVGVVTGACLTSLLVASSTSAGAAAAEPPASMAMLTARDTKFSGGLVATAGSVLGVFVTNQDAYAHSFDVDALSIHVPLSAGSTTFVALKPTATGTLEFYCSVPGHRDAGMTGAISVQ